MLGYFFLSFFVFSFQQIVVWVFIFYNWVNDLQTKKRFEFSSDVARAYNIKIKLNCIDLQRIL